MGFASAHIQKMKAKMCEKIVTLWSTFTDGLTKIEQKNPFEIFMGERKHVNLLANRV